MSRPQTSIWPFLLVLAGLFVLSVTAPRSWQKLAHQAVPRAAKQPRLAVPREIGRTRPHTREAMASPQASAARPTRQSLTPSKHLGKVMNRVEAPSVAQKAVDRDEVAIPDEPMQLRVERTTPAIQTPADRAEAAPEPRLAFPGQMNESEKAAPAAPPSERIAVRERTKPEPPALTPPARPLPSQSSSPKSRSRNQKPAAAHQERAHVAAGPAKSFWRTPEVLMANLDRLALECEATEWATKTGDLIRELCRQEGPATPRAAEILRDLQRLAASAHPLERPLGDPRAAAALGRIQHALARHVEIWRLTPEVARLCGTVDPPTAVEQARLARCLAEVAALTNDDPAGQTWREYLQLNALEAMARQRLNEQAERELVRRVLARLERAAIDERQRQFIAASPLSALEGELHRWVAEPVDPRQLLSSLEQFEESGSPSDAAALARSVRRIADWSSPTAVQTQAWLDTNYRNPNMRMAVTAELLNRLTPRQDPIEAPVRDRILGVPTRGWSRTTADLGIRLIPDSRRVRLALEVQGQVRARTTSRSGPATFYSSNDAEYLASKEITVGLAGVHTQPAQADASNSPQLEDVETDYDNVPLFGLAIEAVARVKHAEQEGAVRRIARQRVTSRVQEELDATVESKLKLANQQFQTRVLEPLKGLSLEPAVAAMHTSEERITVRVRVAADEQLAACTPRPQALADSLASLQVHQSLLNNVVQRLELDGRTFTLPELQRHLAKALALDPKTFSEEYPHDMRIEFAARDAVQVRFVNGRVEITLTVAELRKHPSGWRDFKVRVYYKPVRRGMELRFVRDGTVQLWGERFGAQPQIALRGIFSRAFSQDRELSLIDAKLARDPRLTDLEVTQCVVTDGWLGVSIGPRRIPRTARRP